MFQSVQKMKTLNDLCEIMDNQKDKHYFNKVIYNSYQLILLLLILLVYYGYHFKILARKHMLYLAQLFERYFVNFESRDVSNNNIYIKIEKALQYNFLEHQDYEDDKYLDVFVNDKSKEDIIQQIINNTQFEQLQGKESVYVCLLEQLLKLSEVCSYKYDFINIIQHMKQDFKLQDDEEDYINAYIQLSLQNYNLCIKYIGDVIQMNQFYEKYLALQGYSYNILGRIFTLIGNRGKAIETLCAALNFDGKNNDNYYHFGIALYNNDQYEEALAAFEISQQINSTIRSMLFLGSCYNKLKCDILALRWVNKALKLSPQNKDGLFLKCNCLSQLEQILTNYFQFNRNQIMDIRQIILRIDYIYLERSNNICKLLQSQSEPYNQILDISMAFLISKYYPIEFTEPNEKCSSTVKIDEELLAQQGSHLDCMDFFDVKQLL